MMIMDSFDAVVSLLRDSDWHDLNEISAEVRKVSMTTLMNILNVLTEYGFAEMREITLKGELGLPVVEVKLSQKYLDFLKRIEEIQH